VTVGEVLRRSTEYLAARDIDTPRLDAELLLAKALGRTRLELYLEHDRPLVSDELTACRELIARRGRREPAAYILGEWGFRRLTLAVDSRALVPRPETEVVVERCLVLLAGVSEPRVLDVGTGSGAIALALADEREDARVTALDSSAEALELAKANARRTGLEGRVRFVLRDFRQGLGEGAYDLVVSNPPYVAENEFGGLEPEIREWEPRTALVGGADEASTIAAEARSVLNAGGHLVLETAQGLADPVAQVLTGFGYAGVSAGFDLAGALRVVEGRWEGIKWSRV
jgi:release factor glutamine methyltransferase